MTAYADSVYYISTYLSGRAAVIDTASFAFYANQATMEINRYTYGNISDITDDVKYCTCEVAEYLYGVDNESKNGIKSEKVGEYSVTYKRTSEKEKEKTVYEIIYKHLANTGLMYRGC